MSEIIVRDARKEDAAQIAALIVMAWPVEEFLAGQDGLTLEDFTAVVQGFVENENCVYGYPFTKVAVLVEGGLQDGVGGGVREVKIVGAMNGYDGALYQKLKQPVLDGLREHFGDEGEFAKVIETQEGEFYFDSAGVDPDYRSHGIGSKLFAAMTEKAVSAGYRTLGLIVDVDKPKAEALYLRLGFQFVGYKEFMGHKMKHLQKVVHIEY